MTLNKTILAAVVTCTLLLTGCDKKSDIASALTDKASEVASHAVDAAKDVASVATDHAKEAVAGAASAVATAATVATKDIKATTTSSTEPDQDIRVYTMDNSDGKITPKTIEKAFTDAGFYSAANNDMNFPFTRDFGKTEFDVYNLFALYHLDVVKKLLKEYPSIGLFAPMSISIYTKKGDKTISIASLSTKRIATITGIPADHPALVELDALMVKALKAALPNGHFDTMPYKRQKATGDLITAYSYDIGDKEADDAKEDFENDFESALSPAGFAMPAFNELSDEIEDAGYDFYEVYSICKIAVIHEISKNHPEAGGYAPCSLYVYKKEDENKIHMAYPSVYNWFSSMEINDKVSVDTLMKAQSDMEAILKKIAGK